MDSASYLSAVSIMLGAYGFFYGSYSADIRAGLEVGEPARAEAKLEEQKKAVRKAQAAAWPLALVPLLVWLIFLGPVVEELEAAADVSFSLDHYSAIDVAFFAAANAWLLIAVLLAIQVVKLRRTRRRLG